jgi:hypothetical protein
MVSGIPYLKFAPSPLSAVPLQKHRCLEYRTSQLPAHHPAAAISESPRFVGGAVAALAADPDVHRRTGGSFSSGGLAEEYGFTDVDGSRPDCWRYLEEIQEAGLPAWSMAWMCCGQCGGSQSGCSLG